MGMYGRRSWKDGVWITEKSPDMIIIIKKKCGFYQSQQEPFPGKLRCSACLKSTH